MKIIKLYFKYFICLSNLVIIFVLLLFLGICYILSIMNLNNSLSYNEVIEFYYQNSIYFTKIIFILFSSLLFIKLRSERNEYILNIVISAGFKKKDNYFSMFMFNIIILFVLIIISILLFIIIGFCFKSYFYIKVEYFIYFFNIFCLSIYYGFISYLFSLLFNNQFIFVGPVVLFFISDIIIENKDIFSTIYLTLFPNIKYNGDLSNNIIYLIILSGIVFLINYYSYLKKDLIN